MLFNNNKLTTNSGNTGLISAKCKALHVELVFHRHGCLCLLQLQPLSCCFERSLHLIYLTITAGLCCISRICRRCWCLADEQRFRHTGCQQLHMTGVKLVVFKCLFLLLEEAALLTGGEDEQFCPFSHICQTICSKLVMTCNECALIHAQMVYHVHLQVHHQLVMCRCDVFAKMANMPMESRCGC